MSALRDAALLYAARGWAVFPCRPRRKTPITTHGFHEAATDITQIKQWWSLNESANIGCPTGAAFDVVDFDHIDLYEQARDTHGLDGPQVRTGRGAHFYVAPTGKRGTKLAVSIDFKAAGGYVLLPPSVHPSGAMYAWITRGTPQPAPHWLLTMLSERNGGTAPAGGAATSPKSMLAPGQAFTVRSLTRLRGMSERLARTPEGERNVLLYWAARRAAELGIDKDDVAIVLRDAAREAGLGEREITDTLKSAFIRWT